MNHTRKIQRLKVGKETGSLMNWVMGNNATLPVVGKGATVLLWTDRHAYEVMSVSDDNKTAIIKRYQPKRTDSNGQSESQDYEYKILEDTEITVVWRNGAWREVIKQVVFEKAFAKAHEMGLSKAENAELFDEETHNWRLVPGKTRIQTTYPKLHIIWGRKDEYYDPCF